MDHENLIYVTSFAYFLLKVLIKVYFIEDLQEGKCKNEANIHISPHCIYHLCLAACPIVIVSTSNSKRCIEDSVKVDRFKLKLLKQSIILIEI